MEDSIEHFFDGRSIFITGGTGFMGKVLIEKLLRSCPGIDKIYVLIRPSKQGKSAADKLKEVYDLPVRMETSDSDSFSENLTNFQIFSCLNP